MLTCLPDLALVKQGHQCCHYSVVRRGFLVRFVQLPDRYRRWCPCVDLFQVIPYRQKPRACVLKILLVRYERQTSFFGSMHGEVSEVRRRGKDSLRRQGRRLNCWLVLNWHLSSPSRMIRRNARRQHWKNECRVSSQLGPLLEVAC